MNRVPLLASFNYQPPPVVVFVLGGVAIVGVMVAISRVIAGKFHGLVFGGVLSGLITAGVFASGSGDLRGLLAVFYGTLALVVGAVAGMLCARRPGPRREAPPSIPPEDAGSDGRPKAQ